MTPKHRRMNIHVRNLRMKSKIVKKTLTSSIQSPSMTIADYIGPAVYKGIVSLINEGLLLPSDRSRTRNQITLNRCAPKQAFAMVLYVSDYLSTIDICDSSSYTWPSVKFVNASKMDIVIILTICGSVLEYNKMMPSCNLSFATGALDSAAKQPNFCQRRTMGL